MTRCLLFCVSVFAFLSGCDFFEKQRQPIGYSRDENGRPCATYEIKKDTAYETQCDYGGQYPASVSNPLSKQAPSR